jgi:hypothetical protein
MGGTKISNESSNGMGHGSAVVGGYGILASLDRETAGTQHRAAGQPESAGTRSAIAAGLGVAVLLAWWCFSGPSPVVTYEPKPMWTVAASAPAPTPVAVATVEALAAPAAIVNEVSPLVAALNQPSPPVMAARREVHLAHAVPKPVRREAVHVPARARAPTPKQLPAPADHDVSLLTALVAYTQGAATPHDVVELRMADSTETLLQRCGRVGGEEGRLCRVRICSGRVTDSACQTDR